jgi:hypothetical protein
LAGWWCFIGPKDIKLPIISTIKNQNRIPVFVAIGIGGIPSNPDRLFITPLDHIGMYTHVFESHLSHFKRNPDHPIDNVKTAKIF